MKPGPPSSGPGDDALIARPSRIGAHASTASIARLRRLRNTSASSERKNRAGADLLAGRVTAGAATRIASLVDIETLPGEGHKQVLEVGSFDDQLPNGNTRAYQRSVEVLRLGVVHDCDDVRSAYVYVTEPERSHDFRCSRSARRLHPDRCWSRGPQRVKGSLGDKPTAAQHRCKIGRASCR